MRNKHLDGLLDYSAQNESKQLQDGVTKIIINSQVSAEGQSEDLKALAKPVSYTHLTLPTILLV